ncbi:hypothetical protein [Rhizobium rhizogenes]|uniref:hypothetical protein n=1 Tax=Rhizobium rhizogenes TaxID=359 RepID=UPI0019200D93|nr:hypothetical protein [Rhizobium rhizogenes]
MSAEAVAEAVRAYAEETNRLNHDRRAQAATDQKALQKVERAIAGIMAAIEDGMYQPSMKARMDDLERQKAEIIARQLEVPADIPDVHPNIANLYRRRVERLTEALNDPDGGRQAAEAQCSFNEVRSAVSADRSPVDLCFALRSTVKRILSDISGLDERFPSGPSNGRNAWRRLVLLDTSGHSDR